MFVSFSNILDGNEFDVIIIEKFFNLMKFLFVNMYVFFNEEVLFYYLFENVDVLYCCSEIFDCVDLRLSLVMKSW